MTLAFWRKLGKSKTTCPGRPSANRIKLALEPLEDRRLLALLGVVGEAQAPLITYDSTGTLTYNASTQAFNVDATPLTFTESFAPPSPTRLITAPADFNIQIQINNAGTLVAGAPGDDLVITGNIDIDGNGSIDAAGILLTGEVLAMGFLDGAGGIDQYDFRFRPTGGALQSPYFAGKDIGITLVSEQSSFANSFAVDFTGGAKGNVFAIERLDITPFLFGTVGWEKRTDAAPFPLLGGATFVISPNPFGGVGPLTVVDNGANDADPVPGQIVVGGVLVGTYTITETTPPAGYFLDDDSSRSVTVSEGNLNQVIGTQGQDDPGNTDESDFHNRLGSVAWEKRTDAIPFPLQGGATFELNFDDASGFATIIVIDNGPNDADPVAGQILVNNVPLGTHEITETISPAGFALDDDATRIFTVTDGALAQVIGTQGVDDIGNTDESDFHNRLGTIAWEKRRELDNALQGGAAFEIVPSPLTGSASLIVVDNGPNDANPADGQFLVRGALAGEYAVTEVLAPAGYALDDDANRTVVVLAGTDAVIGVQGQDDPGNLDTSDFHNRLGSIAWEKREAGNNQLLGGAIFLVTPDPTLGTGTMLVVDNGPNDADPIAGRLLVLNVLLDSYTVAEITPPPGFVLESDFNRSVTVTEGDLNAVIGVQGQDDPYVGDGNESDFHNAEQRAVPGGIAWEKRREPDNALQGGAIFEISPHPIFGVGTFTVVDNGFGDADPDLGQFLVLNVEPGVYTVTETVAPPGYLIDNVASRIVVVADGEEAIIGTQGQNDAGDTNESDFHNRPRNIVVTPDKSNTSQPFVNIVNAATGQVVSRFLAYQQTYRGGVRVATGDLNGDGTDEIVTAPGRNHSPVVKVFNQSGNLLYSFLAYDSKFVGGVDVAIGDVDGDGKNDIVTAMTYNGNQVRVFKNISPGAAPFTSLKLSALSSFNPFGNGFKGGATVEVSDLGRPIMVGAVKKLDSSVLDGRAEVIVGSGSGTPASLKVFTFFGSSTVATPVRTYLPFGTAFRGGVTLDVARVNADLVPDIIVSAGNGGASRVLVLNGITGNVLCAFKAYSPPEAPSANAPVHVAAFDNNGDGIADFLFAAQGTDGATRKIRKFDALSGQLVDQIIETTNDFGGAYFLAACS